MGQGNSAPLHCRARHLSADQRAYIAAKYLKPAEEEKARERMEAGVSDPKENFPEGSKGQARDLAAAQVGLSGKTVDTAAKAIEDGIPAVEAALGMDACNIFYRHPGESIWPPTGNIQAARQEIWGYPVRERQNERDLRVAIPKVSS